MDSLNRLDKTRIQDVVVQERRLQFPPVRTFEAYGPHIMNTCLIATVCEQYLEDLDFGRTLMKNYIALYVDNEQFGKICPIW